MTSYALVGTIGAVTVSSSGGSAATAYGAGENRTASNLLLCWAAVTGSATLPTTPAGWTIAAQVAGTSCSATIYWAIATGGDTAPTIAGITGAVINARVGEFSGNQTWTPVDQSSTSNTPTTGTTTATNGAADVIPQELAVGCAAMFYSAAATKTISGSIAIAGGVAGGADTQNGSTSTASHYDMNWAGIANNAGADSDTVTYTSTNITGVAVAFASFRIFSWSPPSNRSGDSQAHLVGTEVSYQIRASQVAAPSLPPYGKTTLQRPLPPIRTGHGKLPPTVPIAPKMPSYGKRTQQQPLPPVRSGHGKPPPTVPIAPLGSVPSRHTPQRPPPSPVRSRTATVPQQAPVVVPASNRVRAQPQTIAYTESAVAAAAAAAPTPTFPVPAPDTKQRPLLPIRSGRARTPVYQPPTLPLPPRAPQTKQRPQPPPRSGKGKFVPLVPVAPLGSVPYGPKIRPRLVTAARSTVRFVPQTTPVAPTMPPLNPAKVHPQPLMVAYAEILVVASITPPVAGIPAYRRIYQRPLPPTPRRNQRQVVTPPPTPTPVPRTPQVKQRPLPPILRRNQRQVLTALPLVPFPITPAVKQRVLPPVLRRNQRQLLTTVAAPLLRIPLPPVKQRPLPQVRAGRGQRPIFPVAPKMPPWTPPVKQRLLARAARGIVARIPVFTPTAPKFPLNPPKIRPQPLTILYTEIQVAAGAAPIPPTTIPPYGKPILQRPLPPIRAGKGKTPVLLPAPAPQYPPTGPKIRPPHLDIAYIEIAVYAPVAPPPAGIFGIPYRPVTSMPAPVQPATVYEIRGYPIPPPGFPAPTVPRPRQAKVPVFRQTRPWFPETVPPAPLGSVPYTPQTKQRPLPTVRRIFNRPPPPLTPYIYPPTPTVRQRRQPPIVRGLPKVPPVLIALPYYPQRPRVQQRVIRPVPARVKLPPIPAPAATYIPYRPPTAAQPPLVLPPVMEIRAYPSQISPPIILTPRPKQRPLPPIRPRRYAPPFFTLPAPLGAVQPSKPRPSRPAPPTKSRVTQFPILPQPPPQFPIPTPDVKQRVLRLPRIFQRTVYLPPPFTVPVPPTKQRPRPPTVVGRGRVPVPQPPPPVYPPWQIPPKQIAKPATYGVGLDRRLAPFTRMIPPVLPAPLGAVPYIPQVKQRPLPPVRKGRYRPIPGVPAPIMPPLQPPPSIVRRLLRLIPFFPRPKLPPVIGPTPIVPTVVIDTQARFLPGGTAANANPGRGTLSVETEARTLTLEVNEP